jgi:hypothetical protein
VVNGLTSSFEGRVVMAKKGGSDFSVSWCMYEWDGQAWGSTPVRKNCTGTGTQNCPPPGYQGPAGEPAFAYVACDVFGGPQTIHVFIPCGWKIVVNCVAGKKKTKKRPVKARK